MSLLTRNNTGANNSGIRDQAYIVVRRAAAMPKQAGPIAKTAGATARQGADVVVAWAAPRVDGARAWAAPRLERSGIAVRETIAPRVSDALVDAAHRLDTRQRARRWPKLLAGMTMLAAAISAAAALMLRRRPEPMPEPPAGQQPEGTTAADAPGYSPATAEADQDANGQARTP